MRLPSDKAGTVCVCVWGGGDTGCGKWDYRGEKNVGSGTIGVKKCGKWDYHFNVGLAIFV